MGLKSVVEEKETDTKETVNKKLQPKHDDLRKVPEDGVVCPMDLRGDSSRDIQCGECRMCINEKIGDIYTEKVK